MAKKRYLKKELLHIRPWPHICPDCKGEPVQIVKSGTHIPFTAKALCVIPDVTKQYDYRIVIRCDLCMGTGTVMK